MLLVFSLSSAAIVPKCSEQNLIQGQGQNPPAKMNKSTKRLYKLKEKRSKMTSSKRINKLSAKIDKIERTNEEIGVIIATAVVSTIAIVLAILGVVLKGTASAILLWVSAGVGLLLLIILGLIFLLKRR